MIEKKIYKNQEYISSTVRLVSLWTSTGLPACLNAQNEQRWVLSQKVTIISLSDLKSKVIGGNYTGMASGSGTTKDIETYHFHSLHIFQLSYSMHSLSLSLNIIIMTVHINVKLWTVSKHGA